MKKLLITMMLLIPLLTGCANIETKVTINDNKSASVISTLKYNGDLTNKNDTTAKKIIENYRKYLDSSYDITREYNSKESKLIATKEIENLSKKDLDLSSLGLESKLESKKFIEIKKNFLVKSFNIHCSYNLPKEIEKNKKQSENNTTISSLTPDYYNRYGDETNLNNNDNLYEENLDESIKKDIQKETSPKEVLPLHLTFSIQVPSIASYNNADTVWGNIYTWEIKENEPTEIKLQYVQYSNFAIFILLMLCIGLITYITIKLKHHERLKRIDNNSETIV